MYVLEKDSNQYNLMGGKATALAKLGMVIENIPDWFVVSYTGFDIDKKEILEDAKMEIESRLQSFSDDDYFAVRSSATKEDSSQNSFAGQFDTFLYVKKSEVIDKVLEVYLSGFSDRIEAYKKENNIDDITVPSAIVQKMVMSEKAGVAFGANPVNSNVKQQIVTAYKNPVNGRNGTNHDKPCPPPKNQPSLRRNLHGKFPKNLTFIKNSVYWTRRVSASSPAGC